MGSASITVNVDGKWRGQAAMDAAANALKKIGNVAGSSATSVASSLKRQEANFNRLSRIAANTAKSTSQGVAQVGEAIVVAGGKLYNLGESMAETGAKLTTAVTVPLTTLAKEAAGSAIAYDTALADVRKVTDMTATEIDRLGKSAIELSKVQPVSANTILEVEALGAQFGIADDMLESFAKTVTGLDIATNMNAEQAATQLAQFKNIVKMSDDEMQNYGSTLVWLGNNFATTESDISNMAARFASAGTQAGLSGAEILGMSAAMSSLGIRSEMGGSALSQVFVQISKAVSAGGDALDAFSARAGMSAEQFARAWKDDAASAFQQLLDGIQAGAQAGEDMNVILSDLGINQIRASDTMRRLAGNTELVRSAVEGANTAWVANTALQNEVDQRNESMASKLQVLRNRAEAIATTLGVPLVNAFLAVMDAVSPAIDSVAAAAQAFADMDEGSQRLAIGIAAVAAASGPAMSALGGIAKGLGGLTTSFGNVVRDTAVYKDALNTLDGAQVRLYSGAETAATKLGLAGNAAVNAAGSVERYVRTWEENYSATKMAEAAQDKLAATGDRLKAVNEKISAAGSKATSKLMAQKDSLMALESELEATVSASEQTASETGKLLSMWSKGKFDAAAMATSTATLGTGLKSAASGLKSAASGFKGVVSSVASYGAALALSLGPQLAITAAIAAAGAVFAEYQREAAEAAEEQERLNDQATTFADVSRAAVAGATSHAEAIESLGEQVRETSDWIGEFNDSMAETLGSIENDAATVDSYISTIERLAGQSNLTAYEQQQLANAVEGYNSITGSSVSIVDAVNGKLSVSTDELKRNAEAWKENARAQAYQEKLIEVTKKQVEAEGELASAKKEYYSASERYRTATEEQSRVMAEYNSVMADGGEVTEELKRKLSESSTEVENNARAYKDAKSEFQEAGRNLQNLNGQANELSYAMAAASEAVKPLKDELSNFGEGFDQALYDAGVNMDEFAVKLQEAGVSTDALKQVGSANIESLATAFGGNIDKMVWAIQNYNSVPIVDKEGNVDVNSASLVAANGEVYTWNGQTLVDQHGSAIAEYATLQAANGQIFIWQNGKLESKSATAEADGNASDGKAETKVKDTDKAIQNLRSKTVSAKADGNAVDGSAKRAIDNTRGSIDSLRSKTVTVTTDYVENHTTNYYTNYSSSGSKKRARGGVMLHADGGFIATGATFLTPRDIVGEAGAEAVLAARNGDRMVVPLTNRQYSQPFAALIAQEVAKRAAPAAPQQRTVVNNNSVYINASEVSSRSPRAAELVRALVSEFNLTAEMGVA